MLGLGLCEDLYEDRNKVNSSCGALRACAWDSAEQQCATMADTGDYILVCVPNKQLLDDPSAKTKTYQEITEVLSDCAAVNKFHLPDLRTGTLERLMQAGR